jgi:hypothetical protein
MDDTQENIRDIVAAIRGALDDLTQEIIDQQAEILDDLGYPYDRQTYPNLNFPDDWSVLQLPEDWGDLKLPDDQDILDIPGDWGSLDPTPDGEPVVIGYRPPTLAEALLWKMGKWKSYVRLVQDFAAAPFGPLVGSRMVFQAFARHLRTTTLPIFDQHALRAMWAIRGIPMDADWQACRSYLMSGDGSWNSTRPADAAVRSYTWYCNQISTIPLADDRAGLRAVDRLLMPLGKALKEQSANLDEFTLIADW